MNVGVGFALVNEGDFDRGLRNVARIALHCMATISRS